MSWMSWKKMVTCGKLLIFDIESHSKNIMMKWIAHKKIDTPNFFVTIQFCPFLSSKGIKYTGVFWDKIQ